MGDERAPDVVSMDIHPRSPASLSTRAARGSGGERGETVASDSRPLPLAGETIAVLGPDDTLPALLTCRSPVSVPITEDRARDLLSNTDPPLVFDEMGDEFRPVSVRGVVPCPF